MKILLEKNRSISSNNKENHIDTDLYVKSRLLPNESIADNFSLHEQYNKERDECEKFRILLTVNPVCSNVLFNVKTEIYTEEGSDNCSVLLDNSSGFTKPVNAVNNTNPVDYLQAIRDTEYSHEDCGNFEYHCGIDIFNNHIIRSNNFVHVNRMNNSTYNSHSSVYNTISDYLRNCDGSSIIDDYSPRHNVIKNRSAHLYTTDSLDNVNATFNEKCREKDGWWGFTNPSYININTSSSDTITVNKMINNKKPCEFIDFYPDRSLFSFTPKYNNYRSRIEKNWDYCITYPFENDYEKVDEICGGEKQAIKCDFKRVVNTSSIDLVQCTSIFRHTLKSGDSINVYYYVVDKAHNTKTFNVYSSTVKVVSVGDNNGNFKDRIFSVRYQDVKMIYDYFVDGFFYKKVVANTECTYCFRKFKKIKNSNNKELRSDINKVAFSKNIYGDDISQIIFTDDVNVDGLVDNNGRKLSEVYFTVIKRNKGHEKWYSRTATTSDFRSEDVEYSHCFGKVTSGLDFSGIGDENEPFDYNIHKMHNLDSEDIYVTHDETAQTTFKVWGDAVKRMPKIIEDDITIDFDEFYGDVVEMDNYNYNETVICNVCHRVNTAQREVFNMHYRDLLQDIIVFDDYDVGTSHRSYDDFTVETYYLNDIESSRRKYNQTDPEDLPVLAYGNIMPEGYFYNPFTKIKIREEDQQVRRSDAKYINYDWSKIDGRPVLLEYTIINGERVLVGKSYYDEGIGNGGNNSGGGRAQGTPDNPMVHFFELSTEGYTLKIRVPINYGFIKGDYVALYDKIKNTIIWGEITKYSKEDMILELYFSDNAFGDDVLDILSHNDYFEANNLNRRYFAFWTIDSVPLYARFSLNSRKFCWKMLIDPSKLSKNDDLYDTTFTNGRFYIHQNVNFFLKRQDPDGKYGLSVPIYSETIFNNPMASYVLNGYNRIDISNFDEIIENMTTCY